MKYSLSGKSLTEAGDHVKLPGLLKKYASSDFTTQQKTRFIFYFCIAAIAAIAFFILAAIYIQLIGEEYGGIYLPVILPELAVMLLFIGCLFLLIRGFYGLASHLLIASGILCVWLVMWVDRGSTVTRLDTIVIIVALLNLAPLFITKYKSAIVFYILVNLVLLLVFLLVFHDQMNLSHAGMIDYFIDTSLAMIFTGIVGYAIFDINKKVLNKALVEIEERRQIEKALVSSEKKYREMTELLPQTIFEADLNGNITYVNKSGYAMFGYDQEDVEQRHQPVFHYINGGKRNCQKKYSKYHSWTAGSREGIYRHEKGRNLFPDTDFLLLKSGRSKARRSEGNNRRYLRAQTL